MERSEAIETVRTAPLARRRARPNLIRPLIYLLLSLYGLVAIAAFLWVILQSLKTNAEFLSTLPWSLPASLQWHNYVDAWQNAQIGQFAGNSVIVSLGSTIGGLVIATLAAYALARIKGVRLSGPLQNFFLMGLMMPAILTVVPLYFLWGDLGLIDSKLGIILIYGGLAQPFSIYYLTAYFKGLPYELEEAATVDGATPFGAFVRIFLPLATPGLVAVFVVNFLWAWNDFYYALIFLTHQSNFTIPIGLYNLQQTATYSAQWVPLFAGMLISVLPVLILYLLLSDQVTKGLTAGALKG